MKMLNCPECGLTVTDAQVECPKCHTKIVSEAETVVEVDTVNTDEKIDAIAAVVEAEALAAIEEEELAQNEENVCELCMSTIEEGQNFCKLCGSNVEAQEATEHPEIPKSDEDSNKIIAAVGYIVFFFPILFGYYRKSKFAKFHAKQATYLFVASVILFMGLVVFRNILNSIMFASPEIDSANIEYAIFTYLTTGENVLNGTPWHHGHITGGFFYWYLRIMLYSLHLLPFILMVIGIVNALQGKKRKLPIVGRFIKDEVITDAESQSEVTY